MNKVLNNLFSRYTPKSKTYSTTMNLITCIILAVVFHSCGSSSYLSSIRDYSERSIVCGGFLTQSRVCRDAKICTVNFYLATTIISHHIFSPLFLFHPLFSLRRYFQGSPPTLDIAWLMMIPGSYSSPQVSRI